MEREEGRSKEITEVKTKPNQKSVQNREASSSETGIAGIRSFGSVFVLFDSAVLRRPDGVLVPRAGCRRGVGGQCCLQGAEAPVPRQDDCRPISKDEPLRNAAANLPAARWGQSEARAALCWLRYLVTVLLGYTNDFLKKLANGG